MLSEPEVDFWIEHIAEPKKLLLAWQAPDTYVDRTRWAVGEITSQHGQVCFRYYQNDEFAEMNLGRGMADIHAAGYVAFPAFWPANREEPFVDRVLEAFARRVPPPDRPDFDRYLVHHRLRQSAPSMMSLLAATGAKLPSDGFELVDPLDYEVGEFEFVLQIAGYRHHCGRSGELTVGELLQLVSEPENQHDSRAIAVEAGGKKIGYVNRLQAPGIKYFLNNASVVVNLLRLNGTPDHPKAFAFVRVRPKAEQAAA